jgi:hypothetical protein
VGDALDLFLEAFDVVSIAVEQRCWAHEEASLLQASYCLYLFTYEESEYRMTQRPGMFQSWFELLFVVTNMAAGLFMFIAIGYVGKTLYQVGHRLVSGLWKWLQRHWRCWGRRYVVKHVQVGIRPGDFRIADSVYGCCKINYTHSPGREGHPYRGLNLLRMASNFFAIQAEFAQFAQRFFASHPAPSDWSMLYWLTLRN